MNNYLIAVTLFMWLIYLCGASYWINNGIQSNRLNQENVPSIEYKYLIKKLLPHPKQNQWWKRGTHRVYAPIDEEPEIVFA
ncbi:unnamed protein product [Ceutorhynchus assimilis]|uniref:Uncharacterized protein n=1 Tax=Ceutorhynchus assimilis TaxID=467358 RepID=A0A9N9QG57_9CUCU|nr:unnamed protein product [Ceutorhynchus assimilis]